MQADGPRCLGCTGALDSGTGDLPAAAPTHLLACECRGVGHGHQQVCQLNDGGRLALGLEQGGEVGAQAGADGGCAEAAIRETVGGGAGAASGGDGGGAAEAAYGSDVGGAAEAAIGSDVGGAAEGKTTSNACR